MFVEYFTAILQQLQTLILQNIIATIAAVIFAWLGYKIIEENLSPLTKIPSPPGRLPLIGHLFTILKHGDLNVVLDKWRDKYGPIITIGPGFGLGKANYRVVLYEKSLIKQVLVTESHKFNRPEFVKELLPGVGNGLFGSSGKAHARQRKMINPAFSFANIKMFVPDFEKSAQELVELWSSEIKDSPTVIEVSDDICHLTLDIIGKTSFGYGFNSVLGKETEISQAFNSLLGGAEVSYVIRSQVIPFYKYLPLPDNLKIKKSIELVNSTVRKVIKEKRMLRKNGTADHKDLLNLLLDAYDEDTGKGFDDEELQAQVFTFMLAGHETTSTSLSWTLYELAKHPDIQEKIRQEIKTVLQDNEDLTWAKLEQLEYLQCVVKESLRRHSPAAFVGRQANQPVCIGGYKIPEGSTVLVPVEARHFSSDLWENPLEFNPERFMKNGTVNNNAADIQYSLLPFSIGPRTCIGNKFAMAEMKTILVCLLKNFQISAVPGFEVKSVMRLTTKPDPPVKVILSKLTDSS